MHGPSILALETELNADSLLIFSIGTLAPIGFVSFLKGRPMDKEKEYKRICEKLGFEPRNYKFPEYHTEDETWNDPFKALTVEEIDFLYENGYLNKKSE